MSNIVAETLWKEARGEGHIGMQAVMSVIVNRARKRGTNFVTECLRRWQFSSMSDPNDAQYHVDPSVDGYVFHSLAESQAWRDALLIAESAEAGKLADVTDGSTLYYNPEGIDNSALYTLPSGVTVKFPHDWNRQHVRYRVKIGKHLFFAEV